ncbi:MAG: hypothetical protein AAF585_00175 [Verrucomicrobiota bacterium]
MEGLTFIAIALCVWQWDNATSPDANLGVLRDRARIGPNFELLLDGGSFESTCELSGDFTIQLHATKFAEDEGEILAIADFSLSACFDEIPKIAHLAVSKQGDSLTAYMDGKLVKRSKAKFKLGDKLIIGKGWSGAIEAILIHDQVLSSEEIETRAKEVSNRIKERESRAPAIVRAKLVEQTAPPKIDELQSYTRALVANVYEVEEQLSGPSIEAKRIVVLQWAIMDRKLIQTERKIGDTTKLSIAPFLQHPQLMAEFRKQDHAEYEAPAFYDLNSHL